MEITIQNIIERPALVPGCLSYLADLHINGQLVAKVLNVGEADRSRIVTMSREYKSTITEAEQQIGRMSTFIDNNVNPSLSIPFDLGFYAYLQVLKARNADESQVHERCLEMAALSSILVGGTDGKLRSHEFHRPLKEISTSPYGQWLLSHSLAIVMQKLSNGEAILNKNIHQRIITEAIKIIKAKSDYRQMASKAPNDNKRKL